MAKTKIKIRTNVLGKKPSGNLINILKRGWPQSLIRLTLAISAGLAVHFIDLDFFEYLTYDWRVRLKPAPAISNEIELIAIDKKTTAELGAEIEAKHHSLLLQKLMKRQPRAIVYTINRVDKIPISGDQDDILNLAKYTQDKPIYFGRDTLFNPEDPSQSQFPEPYNGFKTLQAPIPRDNANFARDRVTRRAVISYYERPTMHAWLASSINNTHPDKVYRGQFKFYNSQQVFINFRPSGTYKPLSFVDVIKERVPLESISEKVILIAYDTGDQIDDTILSPYSREVDAMSNLEAHANILDTLILDNGLIKTPAWLRLLLTCLVSILTVFVVLKVRPSNGLVVIFLTLISLFVVGFLLLSSLDIFIEIANPLLAVFICYYFFIPYRLIMENRKSWEYYHKNKLLTQVEELKSNFMRMMSHDLKTPLARIQGMADVIKGEPNLTPQQNKAVETISESSQELTDFIASILSLGRIESKEVKLNIQSKDINSILKNVIKKYDFNAQSKNIEILTEFEPLFSVQVDEDLIKQVFSNLIENAIKYSHENSKILISTEEIDGKVYIQISDQGIGISPHDQRDVFTKFYRGNEVVNSPIKGSGLGLYLAKYFVELHSGSISIESELHRGSTFTVELPTELNI